MLKIVCAGLLLAASIAGAAQNASMARVVFYRPKAAAISTRALDSGPVTIDGRTLKTRLKAEEYYQADLEPGRHVFCSGDKHMPVALVMEPGKTYYLRQNYKYGASVFPHAVFEIVDAPTGEEQVKQDYHFRDLTR